MTALVNKNRFISIPAVIAYGGFFIMFLVVCYAFVYGDFFLEGAVLVDMAWGLVTLVDLYLGLLLFSFWVIYREDNKTSALSWSVMILLLGNMLSCLYILKSFYESDGSMTRFWLGKRTDSN